MPFAGYKNFADCVRRNQNQENPEAYCGAIQARAEKSAVKKAWQWFIDWLDGPKPEPSEWKANTAIVKVDEEKQIVYGPVLEPLDEHNPDAQEDWYTDADIEAAAHRFMLKAQLGKASADGINHDRWVGHDKAHVVESWVTHEDTQYGDDTVRKGTWMMGVHVPDKELWESVKSGELTGFSIGGRGIRV